jgi:hypothetical protein
MPKKLYPSNALEEAQKVLSAWQQFENRDPFGEITLQGFSAEIDQVTVTLNEIVSLETQLTYLRNRRDTEIIAVWEKTKRVRSGIKGYYGDDSSQYEMAGGTRRSERKPRKRKSTSTEK